MSFTPEQSTHERMTEGGVPSRQSVSSSWSVLRSLHLAEVRPMVMLSDPIRIDQPWQVRPMVMSDPIRIGQPWYTPVRGVCAPPTAAMLPSVQPAPSRELVVYPHLGEGCDMAVCPVPLNSSRCNLPMHVHSFVFTHVQGSIHLVLSSWYFPPL